MKKIPERSCIACRRKISRDHLLRIVLTQDGRIGVEPDSSWQGRSAYLCIDWRCLAEAKKKRALQYALRHPVEERVWQQIAELISRKLGNDPHEELL